MYANKALATSEPEEESKEPVSLSQSGVFTQEDMESYDFAGVDQQKMAPKLAFLNNIMSSISAAYSALNSIVKQDGQPGNELAQRVLSAAKPSFDNLYAAIETLGSQRSD